MPIVTSAGAVITTADAVDPANVVYIGGIACRASDGAMYVSHGLTTAQVAALAYSGSAKTIEAVEAVHGNIASSGLATTTWQHIVAARSASYAVRVIWENQTTSPYTVTKTAISGSSALSLLGDPTGGTWTNITYAGSASVVVPAAADANSSAFTASDWVAVAPVVWTGGGSKTLWYLRNYQVATGHPYVSQNVGAYAGNATGGLVRQFSTMSGDKIGTPTGFTGSNGGLVAMPFSLEFRTLARNIRVLGLGDSITQGGASTATGGQVSSFGERACNLANASRTDRIYSFLNFGWPSQTFAQIYARLPILLTTYAPDIVMLPVYSPNGAGFYSQAEIDGSIALMLDAVNQCRTIGAMPIFWSGVPTSGITLSNDNFRKTVNLTMKTYCVAYKIPFIDMDLIASDQASPASWISSLSADNIHPNDAGTDAMAIPAAAVYLVAI